MKSEQASLEIAHSKSLRRFCRQSFIAGPFSRGAPSNVEDKEV